MISYEHLWKVAWVCSVQFPAECPCGRRMEWWRIIRRGVDDKAHTPTALLRLPYALAVYAWPTSGSSSDSVGVRHIYGGNHRVMAEELGRYRPQQPFRSDVHAYTPCSRGEYR